MALTGSLAEYSLAEIFRFIFEGKRSGLLEIGAEIDNIAQPQACYYLWFENGRIVAVTSGLSGRELLKTIGQRKFISQPQIDRILEHFYEIDRPLGIYLKSQGLLDAEQLKLLYFAQTINPLGQLFRFNRKPFQFDAIRADSTRLLACTEMTGVRLTAQEVGIKGLRSIKDWSWWMNKLPCPDYAIQKCGLQQPEFRFDLTELKLWSLADGKTPLTKLATQIDLPIEDVLWVSYRLILFGFVWEIPIKQTPNNFTPTIAILNLESSSKNSTVSKSFLGNLKNFLKKDRSKTPKSSIDND